MNDAPLRRLYRLSVSERVSALESAGLLSAADAEAIRQGRHVLLPAAADRMIENVVGVFGLPLAIAPNFIVNGRETVVPMVVEEPSIIAGVSAAAKLARAAGGFTASSGDNCLVGQIHLLGVADIAAAKASLEAGTTDLLAAANAVHPRLAARGGGVRDLRYRLLAMPDGSPLLAVHVVVDTVDAMGANLVNGICESLAPKLVEAVGGQVALRILSNLADDAMVTANVRYRLDDLRIRGFAAADVRDQIVAASDIARVDPYRTATHNKGIMNGIDALALATGNDWRAIEAGAHAYAATDGYAPLATWRTDSNGDLIGELIMPLKVATVGGTLAVNRTAATCLDITGVRTARELAELMAAVGLAQNFAALRALATHGIQRGHMHLHARSVVAATGASAEEQPGILRTLIASGDITAANARRIAAEQRAAETSDTREWHRAAGKVILLGEHAVVYGAHALAVPLPDSMAVAVTSAASESTLRFLDAGVEVPLVAEARRGITAMVTTIAAALGVDDQPVNIDIRSDLPAAMGLGSSAALAVALVRALAAARRIEIDHERCNALAYDCEKLAHGTPSGLDNTLATYSQPLLFRNPGILETRNLTLVEPLPIVIACSQSPGLTRQQVDAVRQRHAANPAAYDAIFKTVDELSLAGAEALEAADYATLGDLMNVCQGLLNAIGVSTAELEAMISLARSAGAVGAKLTGGGGGGSIVALCPGAIEPVVATLRDAGFRTIVPARMDET